MKNKAIFLSLILMLFFASPSPAAQSPFRQEFVKTREANNFEALVLLVKKNKEIIPAEVKSLLKEARSGEKTYFEKIKIIDTAGALAAMHKFWNEDEAPLAEVDAVQKQLITAENERLAEVEKLARYERYPGNVLMNSKEANLYAKGLSPVVFPHWSHRLFYECKACHNGLFKAERGVNNISHAAIREGRVCGACHNGSIAFSAFGALDSNKNCEKCHSASKTSTKGPIDPSTDLNLTSVKQTGDSIGAKWNPEGLINRSLPLDRFGHIDWMELKKTGAHVPLKSHNKAEVKDQTRGNIIIFTPQMSGINMVPFNHATHTDEINCDTCHPAVFKDAIGANKATKTDMVNGLSCGYCHDKVAFKLAECKRCHSILPNKKNHDPNVLLR